MEVFDIFLYLLIAIFLNLFVHTFANWSYKDLNLDEKIKKTTSLLVITGIICVSVSIFFKDKKEIISRGLKYGGSALVLTAMVANWEDVRQELKLFVFGSSFLYVLIYSYNKDNDGKNNKNNVASKNPRGISTLASEKK